MSIPIFSPIMISKLIIIILIIQSSFVLCLELDDIEDTVNSVDYTEHIEKQLGETVSNINNTWANFKNDTTEDIGNTVNDINQWFKDKCVD